MIFIDEKKSEMLDMFAAQAMSGLLAKHGSTGAKDTYSVTGDGFRTLAETSYEVASCMMAQRDRVHEDARRTIAAQQKNAEQLAAFDAKQRAREQAEEIARSM